MACLRNQRARAPGPEPAARFHVVAREAPTRKRNRQAMKGSISRTSRLHSRRSSQTMRRVVWAATINTTARVRKASRTVSRDRVSTADNLGINGGLLGQV